MQETGSGREWPACGNSGCLGHVGAPPECETEVRNSGTRNCGAVEMVEVVVVVVIVVVVVVVVVVGGGCWWWW